MSRCTSVNGQDFFEGSVSLQGSELLVKLSLTPDPTLGDRRRHRRAHLDGPERARTLPRRSRFSPPRPHSGARSTPPRLSPTPERWGCPRTRRCLAWTVRGTVQLLSASRRGSRFHGRRPDHPSTRRCDGALMADDPPPPFTVPPGGEDGRERRPRRLAGRERRHAGRAGVGGAHDAPHWARRVRATGGAAAVAAVPSGPARAVACHGAVAPATGHRRVRPRPPGPGWAEDPRRPRGWCGAVSPSCSRSSSGCSSGARPTERGAQRHGAVDRAEIHELRFDERLGVESSSSDRDTSDHHRAGVARVDRLRHQTVRRAATEAWSSRATST